MELEFPGDVSFTSSVMTPVGERNNFLCYTKGATFVNEKMAQCKWADVYLFVHGLYGSSRKAT